MTRLSHSNILTVAMLAIAAPLYAGTPGGQAQAKPHAPAKTQPAQGKPVAAAHVTPAASAAAPQLSLTVLGLKDDNQAQVKSALSALSETVWVCPGCKAVHDQKGLCKGCSKDLVSETRKVLGEVKTDVASGSLSLKVNAGTQLKLSELQRALAASSAKLDLAKLSLAGSSELDVQGPGDAASAKKLEDALGATKYFDQLAVHHVADARAYRVSVRPVSGAPTQAVLEAAVQHVGEGFKLVDIAWGAPNQPS